MLQWAGKDYNIRMSHPCYFGSKTFDVVLLSFQNVLGDEHRERAVPHANASYFLVEPVLHLLPDKV